jgi:peptide-methionine (S)-S-oxide reductase
MDGEPAVATFAAGCFWGVEEAFRTRPGVIETAVGYTGGTKPDPSYEQVCTGRTGHAEAVRVVYDPARITYRALLDRFFAVHDPTTRNRQGLDIGEQYRSAIFYHTPEQEREARPDRELDRSGRFRRPIATELIPAGPFYRSREYTSNASASTAGAAATSDPAAIRG